MNLEANLQSYLGGDGPNPDRRKPDERYVSFDYCFNYFQSFRESGNVSGLASPANVQLSCLHLGFYLASWGMLRGSAGLLQKNVKYLVPVVEVVATTGARIWEIDADRYDGPNIRSLLDLAHKIRNALPGISVTDTLLTKIMLGVFGSVPAFDDNFAEGCKAEGLGLVKTFDVEALQKIVDFYRRNAAVIDSDTYRVRTLDFDGGYTLRRYTRAKVIDMALVTEGERMGPERKGQAKGKRRTKGA